MSNYSADPVRFGSISMVTATLGENDPQLGDSCKYDGGEYVFVYNAGTDAQIQPGYGAICSGATNYSVTVSTVVTSRVAIGICKHATLTTGTYGWLLTKGFCNFEASTTVAAGDGLVIGTDGLWDLASGSTLNTVGQAQAIVATGASGVGYFRF